jgi:phosphatidylserine decarboxylase
MGRFLLGSTVVMLFPQGVMQFNADWTPTRPIRMGEAMGQVPQTSMNLTPLI